MNKETVRPILLAEVERCREVEKTVLELPVNIRQEVRLKRLQAELQLWLADQQWARQEREEREETPTLIPTQLPASSTTKP